MMLAEYTYQTRTLLTCAANPASIMAVILIFCRADPDCEGPIGVDEEEIDAKVVDLLL